MAHQLHQEETYTGNTISDTINCYNIEKEKKYQMKHHTFHSQNILNSQSMPKEERD